MVLNDITISECHLTPRIFRFRMLTSAVNARSHKHSYKACRVSDSHKHSHEPSDNFSMSTLLSFDKALQLWTEIDLPLLQKRLDENGLAVKEDQKALLVSRKNLAAKTKDFKKLDDLEKLLEIKPLLKLYQNEIDKLTNQKKLVEGHFFEVYRVLSEAPDPKPLLQILLDLVIKSAEVDELNEQLQQVTTELNKRADYDQIKQRLLQLEQLQAETLSQRVKAKEDEYKSIIEEKESNWSDKERQLQKQLTDAQKQIEELRTNNEVSELQASNNLGSNDKASAAVLAELDFVHREAELLKKRCYELEKRNELLRSKLATAELDLKVLEMEAGFKKQILELEGENSLLVANLDQVRSKLDQVLAEKTAQSSNEIKHVQQLTEELSKVKRKLEKVHDYEELKHELQLLRQLEFGVDDDEDTAVNSQLVTRNKQLTNQVVELRELLAQFQQQITTLQQQVEATSTELQRVKKLNVKLEEDLAGVDTLGSRFNDTGLMMLFAPLVATQESSAQPLILPIITKQRDRFRDRNAELEDEAKRLNTTIAELKRQVGHLKQDNEQLYERTQYMALFSNNKAKRLTPKANLHDNPYREQYELKMHPVEQFRIQEQERISLGLNPIERLFILLTRTILATRLTRMVFFFYCLGLHLVVMMVTIYLMLVSLGYVPDVSHRGSLGGLASGQVGRPDTLGKVVE